MNFDLLYLIDRKVTLGYLTKSLTLSSKKIDTKRRMQTGNSNSLKLMLWFCLEHIRITIRFSLTLLITFIISVRIDPFAIKLLG